MLEMKEYPLTYVYGQKYTMCKHTVQKSQVSHATCLSMDTSYVFALDIFYLHVSLTCSCVDKDESIFELEEDLKQLYSPNVKKRKRGRPEGGSRSRVTARKYARAEQKTNRLAAFNKLMNVGDAATRGGDAT